MSTFTTISTTIRILLIGTVITFVAACTSDDSSSSDKLPAELKGTWVIACTEDSGQSATVELTITEAGFESSAKFWNNPNCAGSRNNEIIEVGELVVGAAFLADSGVTVHELDITGTQTDVSDGNMENIDGFDLYYIANGNQLYFGDSETGNGNTPEDRPTDVDYSEFFTKVQ